MLVFIIILAEFGKIGMSPINRRLAESESNESRTTASMYRLPQEIIDLIVDAIGGRNRADLCRVALTAHVFLHQAQSHLFRSIKLELSYCIKRNSEDLDTFHAILLQSPNIKFYIREIFVNALILSHESESYYDHRAYSQLWSCPHHARAGPQQRHILSPKLIEQFHIRNISHLFSIIPMLSHLGAIRLNYASGPSCRRDWRLVLSNENLISLISFKSITTLTLSSLTHVPMFVMDSILQLSQLTALIIDEMMFDSDDDAESASVLHHPRQSQLTNLHTFGFVQINYYPVLPTAKDMTEIAALIVHSASQTLHKLIWSDRTRMRDYIDMQHLSDLTNLRIISTGAQECHYQLTLQPLILQIIASNLQTIEVVELFDMEETCRRLDIEKVCECWTELDGLLEDKAFSSLKEIRLLFKSFKFIRSDDLARSNSSLMYDFFTTEEIVSMFESCLLKSSARGIRITYNLTYGRDGLLESY